MGKPAVLWRTAWAKFCKVPSNDELAEGGGWLVSGKLVCVEGGLVTGGLELVCVEGGLGLGAGFGWPGPQLRASRATAITRVAVAG